jgi:hypothetical protein
LYQWFFAPLAVTLPLESVSMMNSGLTCICDVFGPERYELGTGARPARSACAAAESMPGSPAGMTST